VPCSCCLTAATICSTEYLLRFIQISSVVKVCQKSHRLWLDLLGDRQQLNGKVERSQKTDKIEFYALADLDDPELPERLSEWQFYYNWQRPHGSLNGKPPMQVAGELAELTPLWEDVGREYRPGKERLQHQNYQVDFEVRKLKECP